PVEKNGVIYTRVSIPGCDSTTGEPGLPAVPIFRRLIAVPEGAQVQAACETDEAETIFVNLLPVQPPPVDGTAPVPGPAPDPSVFADKPFTLNEEAYASDEPYPAEECRVTDLG